MPRVLSMHKLRGVLPAGAVYVGRPTKWGNPFIVGRDGKRVDVVRKYRELLTGQVQRGEVSLEELRGVDVACYCHEWDGLGPSPDFCHADVIVDLANR